MPAISDAKRNRSNHSRIHNFLQKVLDFIDTHPIFILSLIILLAIVVTVTINLESLPPTMRYGESDSWWVIAQNLIHGHGYSLCLQRYFPFCGPTNQVTAAREPLPVLLFAAVAWLGHESLWIAVSVEFVIYLSVLVVIYLLTREWADSRSGLIAALIWTIYIPAIELVPQVSGDLLAALLVSIGILLVLHARKTRRIRAWALAGFILGLAVISRSGTLAIVLMVSGGIMLESWMEGSKWKDGLYPALLVFSLTLLIMSPWLIRNKLVLGRPVLGSSLVGYNMYRHNYMITGDNYFRYVGGAEGLKAMDALLARRTDLLGTENEAQMDIVYRQEALKIISAHPVQYILLSAFRFFPLWFNLTYYEAYNLPVPHEDYWIMILQGMLLVLVLLGLRGNLKRSWPLWSSVAALSLIYMAVDAQLLYLIPVMPLAISLSGASLGSILKKRFNDSGG